MTYQDKHAVGVPKDAADLQNDARISARIDTPLTQPCSLSGLITALRGIVRREQHSERKEATSLLVEMLENGRHLAHEEELRQIRRST